MADLAEIETIMRTALDGTDPAAVALLRKIEAALLVRAGAIADGTLPGLAAENATVRTQLDALVRRIAQDSRMTAVTMMRLLLGKAFGPTPTPEQILALGDQTILTSVDGVLRAMAKGLHPERV